MDGEITGTLEEWSGTGEENTVVYGRIYGDSRGRFTDGTHIRTSYLPDRQELKEGVIIKTNNSQYRLGKAA